MYKLDYIKESMNRFSEQRDEYDIGGFIQVYVKDKFETPIDINMVISQIYTSIPHHLLSEVDSLFIGMFDEFEEMDTNAMYKNGAIYVSNTQDNEEDLADDIIHEIAHSIEEPYGYVIYGDGELEREFLQKRKKLYEILREEGLHPDEGMFSDPVYSQKMDLYLYEDVGYDRLNFIALSYGLYTSAYSATSLREYFANGFEYYFIDNPDYLQEICPILYKKIKEIHEDDQH